MIANSPRKRRLDAQTWFSREKYVHCVVDYYHYVIPIRGGKGVWVVSTLMFSSSQSFLTRILSSSFGWDEQQWIIMFSNPSSFTWHLWHRYRIFLKKTHKILVRVNCYFPPLYNAGNIENLYNNPYLKWACSGRIRNFQCNNPLYFFAPPSQKIDIYTLTNWDILSRPGLLSNWMTSAITVICKYG